MKNRDFYRKDPAENRLLNHGVAEVTDVDSAEERRTLRCELDRINDHHLSLEEKRRRDRGQ